MTEEWLPIREVDGAYEVSSHGRVRHARLRRIVLGSVDPRDGYIRVVLRRQGDRLHRYVHRLVAEAFIPNPEGHTLVRHWDDNPSNNAVGNLMWGTHSDNRLDSVRNGTHANASKTHCKRGHEFTPENTYPRPGGRECRACRNLMRRERAA